MPYLLSQIMFRNRLIVSMVLMCKYLDKFMEERGGHRCFHLALCNPITCYVGLHTGANQCFAEATEYFSQSLSPVNQCTGVEVKSQVFTMEEPRL